MSIVKAYPTGESPRPGECSRRSRASRSRARPRRSRARPRRSRGPRRGRPRYSRARPRHSSLECRGVRDSGTHTGPGGLCPRFQRQAPSFQCPVHSGAHTGRRGGRVVSPAPGRRHSSEGWNPACATAERTRGGGAEGLCPRFLSPQKPRIPGFCRLNPTSTAHCPIAAPTPTLVSVVPVNPPSFQRRLESSVRDSGAHTGRRGGRVVSEVPVSAETSHPWVLPPQPNDNSPLPHRRANPYIGLRRSCESPVIPAKAGIQRARQRSAHGAEGRKGCVRGSCLRRNLASLGSAAPNQRQLPITPLPR